MKKFKITIQDDGLDIIINNAKKALKDKPAAYAAIYGFSDNGKKIYFDKPKIKYSQQELDDFTNALRNGKAAINATVYTIFRHQLNDSISNEAIIKQFEKAATDLLGINFSHEALNDFKQKSKCKHAYAFYMQFMNMSSSDKSNEDHYDNHTIEKIKAFENASEKFLSLKLTSNDIDKLNSDDPDEIFYEWHNENSH